MSNLILLISLIWTSPPIQVENSTKMDSMVMLDTLISKGEKYLYAEWDSAFFYLTKADSLARLLEEDNKVGKVANLFGTLYYVEGDYVESIRYYSIASEIFNKTQDESGLNYALNGRGLIYLSQNQLERAIDIFNRCIEISKKLGDTYGIGKNYFNRSIGEADLGQFDKAHRSIDLALEYLKDHQDRVIYTMTLNRAGKIYFDEGKLEDSEKYYKEVLNYPGQLSNWASAFAYTGLAEIEFTKGNPKAALEYGEIAKAYIDKTRAYWDKGRLSKLLMAAYEQIGQYGLALEYSKQYKSYSDSLYNENKNAEISYLQLLLANADNQNLLNEKELAENSAQFNKKFTIILAIVLVGMIIGFILYGRVIRQKEKINQVLLEKQREIQIQNEKLEAINEEKNRLFSILSHDLKAPINSVKQLLELEENGLLDEDEQKTVRKLLIKQVSDTDEMLRKLLRWSHAQLDGIITNRTATNLTEIIKEQVDQLDYQTVSKNITIDFSSIFENALVLVDPQQFRIILQNCLQNSIKFSNSNSQIKLWNSVQEEGGFINLHIKDYGIGISEEKMKEISSQVVRVKSTEGTQKEKGTGLGLLLVRQFMEKNQGHIHIQSKPNEGTEIILSFERINATQEPIES
ncbi:tetratricopeptide repeat protein [Algoriphagus lutimaris]|uniref:tetratricopeptide repeat-containing sensor histidine kinase n=1 Tax=Algoriphagus lutimaris TaxID=613197 RepID=UPI00196AF389|nr:tetratricopeptide repeat-containing sensor histidine kinase [Algoriphagus lutimaris]MBN3520024.1 tetratricopeptide repeat protein [Algoriphagus lutimaris]